MRTISEILEGAGECICRTFDLDVWPYAERPGPEEFFKLPLTKQLERDGYTCFPNVWYGSSSKQRLDLMAVNQGCAAVAAEVKVFGGGHGETQIEEIAEDAERLLRFDCHVDIGRRPRIETRLIWIASWNSDFTEWWHSVASGTRTMTTSGRERLAKALSQYEEVVTPSCAWKDDRLPLHLLVAVSRGSACRVASA